VVYKGILEGSGHSVGTLHQYLFNVMVPSGVVLLLLLLVVMVVVGWRGFRTRVILLISRGVRFVVAVLHCNGGHCALCHLQPGNVDVCVGSHGGEGQYSERRAGQEKDALPRG